MTPRKPAIILVSSHVARGGVGGRLQAFVLERIGFPVVFVPTVTLPWHPGEGRGARSVPSAEDFAALVGDLAAAPWLGSVGAILSGYLGAADQAGPVAALVAAARARNPALVYLCDPVIGDASGPYRPPAIVAAIRDRLLPLADMATPNRHELALLLGDAPADNEALIAAARTTGVGEIVVTSAFGGSGEAVNLLVTPAAVLLARHEALPAAPRGTGDLLAALYLAHRLDGLAAPEALRRAAGATLKLAGTAAGGGELPVAGNQAALFDEGAAVALSPLAGI